MASAAPIAQTSNLLPLNQLPVEKLQGPKNWEAWYEALVTHAKSFGFWNVISGDNEKPEATWKQKDLCAIELILNSISQELHVELEDEYEQLNTHTMTSKDLLRMIHETVVVEPELERFVTLEDFVLRFNPFAVGSFASAEAFNVDLMQEWTKIKAKYPDTDDSLLEKVALLGLESFDEADSCLHCSTGSRNRKEEE